VREPALPYPPGAVIKRYRQFTCSFALPVILCSMTGDSFRGMLHSRNAISGSLSEKGALSRASVLQGANDQDPIGIDRPAHVGTRPRGCDTARLLSFPKCSILLFDSIEAKNTGGRGVSRRLAPRLNPFSIITTARCDEH